MPSYVDVPLPISSNKIKECSLASCNARFASLISTINVDWPLKISSLAPIRVKILSKTGILHDLQGTKHPICAIIIIKAVCLIYVDLPPMLGPVINKIL